MFSHQYEYRERPMAFRTAIDVVALISFGVVRVGEKAISRSVTAQVSLSLTQSRLGTCAHSAAVLALGGSDRLRR